jgi:hypothetical protein
MNGAIIEFRFVMDHLDICAERTSHLEDLARSQLGALHGIHHFRHLSLEGSRGHSGCARAGVRPPQFAPFGHSADGATGDFWVCPIVDLRIKEPALVSAQRDTSAVKSQLVCDPGGRCGVEIGKWAVYNSNGP